MNTKNKLDKAAYIMLNISSAIALLLAVVSIGFTIWTCVYAVNDTLAGGWILFFIGLVGVFFCPVVVLWLGHGITQIVGLIQYRKNNIVTARILGMVNAFSLLIGNATLVWLGVVIFGENKEVLWLSLALTVVPGIGILYAGVVLVLLIVSMCKSKKKEEVTNYIERGE